MFAEGTGRKPFGFRPNLILLAASTVRLSFLTAFLSKSFLLVAALDLLQ